MAISETIIIDARNKAKAAFDQLEKDAKTATTSVSGTMSNISGGAKSAGASIGGLVSSMGSAIGTIGTLSIAGITLSKVLSGVSQFMHMAVAEAGEAEQINAQLTAVLQSTGHAAGITTKEIEAYAEQIGAAARVEDDLITRGAALLLTFTNIKREVFSDTIQAALDMTAVLNQGEITMGGFQSTIIQVGKAMNDPIEGLTALRRVGVSFTEEQEDMIKVMVESGDVMGAQKMILQELQKEFGNAAEIMGDTYAGSINAVKNAWKDLGETVATPFLPLLSQMNNDVATLIGGLTEWAKRNVILYPQQKDLSITTQELVNNVNDGVISVDNLTGAWLNNVKITEQAADAMQAAREKITVAGLAAGISGQMGSAFDDYKGTIADLQKEEAELTAELEKAIRLGWSETSKKVTGLNNDLAANKAKQQEAAAAIKETTNALIYQQAAAGLDTYASLNLAKAMGVLSERDFAVASTIENLRQKFDDNADGMISASEGANTYASTVKQIVGALSRLDTAGTEVTVQSLTDELVKMTTQSQISMDEIDTVSNAWAGDQKTSITGAVSTAKTNVQEFFDSLSSGVSDSKVTVQGLADMIEELPENKTITITANIITNYITTYSGGAGGGYSGAGTPGVTTYDMGGGATAMAGGGSAYAGKPYVVGDPGSGGQEVFVPNANGFILNRNQAQQALAAGNGGGYVDQSQVINLYVSDNKAAALAAAMIRKERQDRINTLMGG
ncbi:MAG: hypothetical protein JW908_00530 [Anaerolineales bacterium]|nr:hypothetical protein [Anaerolineales bacterium]